MSSIRTKTLFKRILAPGGTEIGYRNILVPIFGSKLDDDIVATAGRLADAADEKGEVAPRLDVIYFVELPLSVPLDSVIPSEVREPAEEALERASHVADEYETVEVSAELIPSRNAGGGIVDEARSRGTEVIVMGAEPPSKVRGGAILGGIGAPRPKEIGPTTEFVLRKAPCRVLLTAPPEDADGEPTSRA